MQDGKGDEAANLSFGIMEFSMQYITAYRLIFADAFARERGLSRSQWSFVDDEYRIRGQRDIIIHRALVCRYAPSLKEQEQMRRILQTAASLNITVLDFYV